MKKAISNLSLRCPRTLFIVPTLVALILLFYAITNSANVTSYDWKLHEEPFHILSDGDGVVYPNLIALRRILNPHIYESNGFIVYTIFGWLANINFHDIASFRFLSSLCGFGAIALMLPLGRAAASSSTAKGWHIGLYASFWLATNICFAAFTSFGRFYAFNAFCCTLSLYFLLKALNSQRQRYWIFYALAMVGSVGSQLLSLSTLAIHFFLVLYVAARRRTINSFLIATLAPLLVFAFLFSGNPNEYSQFNRRTWDIKNAVSSLLFYGSNTNFQPSFMYNLSQPKAWPEPNQVFSIWPQLPAMYFMGAVSTIFFAYIIGIAGRALKSISRATPLDYSSRVLHGCAVGSVVLAVLLLLFHFLCKPLITPLDISWFYPTLALLWGLFLQKSRFLRWALCCSALLIPGHVWASTYAQGSSYSRILNVFSDAYSTENILVTNFDNLPRNRCLNVNHFYPNYFAANPNAKLSICSDLAYLANQYNYLAYTDRNSEYLLASQLRALPFGKIQLHTPIFWIITAGYPHHDLQIQHNYLLTVLADLEAQGYCHCLKGRRTPIIWVNMRPLSTAEDNVS